MKPWATRLRAELKRQDGFSIPELLVAAGILAVIGGATAMFFDRISAFTTGVQVNMAAHSEGARRIKSMREDFKRLGGQFSIPSTAPFKNIQIGNSSDYVMYTNVCQPIPSSMGSLPLPRSLSGDPNFQDCPSSCPKGQRPMVQISRSSGGIITYIPSPQDRQLTSAMLCASQPSNTQKTVSVHLFLGYTTRVGFKKRSFWEVKSAFLSETQLMTNVDKSW